jgi:hypothetical protein
MLCALSLRAAVEAVCDAARAHPADAATQDCALHALSNLVSGADAASRAHAAGGVAAALSALHAHGACAPVQQYGCGALSDLAEHCEEAAADATAAGAIEAVCAAMRAHAAAASVQVCACRALNFLCARRHGALAAAARAVAAGAVEAVQAAAEAHGMSHTGVRQFSAAVLTLLRENAGGTTDLQPRMAGAR